MAERHGWRSTVVTAMLENVHSGAIDRDQTLFRSHQLGCTRLREDSDEMHAVTEADLQQQVLAFLDRSSFGPAKGGKRIDTHASMVFLGADRALKIKRAVRLPFLDYFDACEAQAGLRGGTESQRPQCSRTLPPRHRHHA